LNAAEALKHCRLYWWRWRYDCTDCWQWHRHLRCT